MKPRLRGTVTCVPTPEGMLFRAGDRFLPVRGKGAWAWFERFRTFLDGRSSVESLCDPAGEATRAVVLQVLDSLRKADMLYDADTDRSEAGRELEGIEVEPFFLRIESDGTDAFLRLQRILKTRLLVVGDTDIALPIIQAGLEAKLGKQTLCAKQWNSDFDETLKTLVASRQTRDFSPIVERIPYEHLIRLFGGVTWESAFDEVLVAADLNLDTSWLDDFFTCCKSSSIGMTPLFIQGATIVVGTPRSEGAGCIDCLRTIYAQTGASLEKTPAFLRSTGLSMASRILVQRLMDFLSGLVPRWEQLSFSELDLESLQIRRRPLVSNAACDLCTRGTKRSVTPRWPFGAEQPDEFPIREFLQRAEMCLVDPKTGIIERLDEGDLLQFPYHQSAALSPTADRMSASTWLTEVGADIFLARVAVIRRVMERCLLERLSQLSPNAEIEVFRDCRSGGESRSIRALPRGVVVSATSWGELSAEAFFRALACYANESDDWTDVPIPRELMATSAGLVLGYFEDLDILKNMAVQRHPSFSAEGCDLLRFFYSGKCVSVVAGPSGTILWETGLKDLWLRITAYECFADGCYEIGTQFRSAALASAALSERVRSLSERFNLQLHLAPLPWSETKCVEPFCFSYAFLSSAQEQETSLSARMGH